MNLKTFEQIITDNTNKAMLEKHGIDISITDEMDEEEIEHFILDNIKLRSQEQAIQISLLIKERVNSNDEEFIDEFIKDEKDKRSGTIDTQVPSYYLEWNYEEDYGRYERLVNIVPEFSTFVEDFYKNEKLRSLFFYESKHGRYMGEHLKSLLTPSNAKVILSDNNFVDWLASETSGFDKVVLALDDRKFADKFLENYRDRTGKDYKINFVKETIAENYVKTIPSSLYKYSLLAVKSFEEKDKAKYQAMLNTLPEEIKEDLESIPTSYPIYL